MPRIADRGSRASVSRLKHRSSVSLAIPYVENDRQQYAPTHFPRAQARFVRKDPPLSDSDLESGNRSADSMDSAPLREWRQAVFSSGHRPRAMS